MTWIVGAAAPLGYAIGISDICVSFSDGSERDCLQKIYPIARFIAAGFAGSVRIGFRILNGLAVLLGDAPDDQSYIPEEVADGWSEVARDIFQSCPPEERALHSHLMLLGAHPTHDVGIPDIGLCSVYTLKSPDFSPALARIGEVVSIGSGSGIAPYKEALERVSSNPMTLIQGEHIGRGYSSLNLSMIVEKTIEKFPAPGISPHMHVCLVYRGLVNVSPNDRDTYPPNGEKIEFRMSPVATSWAEFKRMASEERAQHAVC